MKNLLIALGFITVSATDAAALIRVDLEGAVYYRSGDAVPAFQNGEKASAWFEFNEDAAGQQFYPNDPSIYFYRYAPISGGMTVGSYSVTFSKSARMFVTNQEKASYGPIDRVLLDDHDPIGVPLNGRAVDAVGISWQDNTATALSDLALPTTQATFNKFASVTSSIDWTPYVNADHRVSVLWTNVKVAAVPEPGTWMMMMLGFGAVGYSLRRKPALRFV